MCLFGLSDACIRSYLILTTQIAFQVQQWGLDGLHADNEAKERSIDALLWHKQTLKLFLYLCISDLCFFAAASHFCGREPRVGREVEGRKMLKEHFDWLWVLSAKLNFVLRMIKRGVDSEWIIHFCGLNIQPPPLQKLSLSASILHMFVCVSLLPSKHTQNSPLHPIISFWFIRKFTISVSLFVHACVCMWSCLMRQYTN